MRIIAQFPFTCALSLPWCFQWQQQHPAHSDCAQTTPPVSQSASATPSEAPKPAPSVMLTLPQPQSLQILPRYLALPSGGGTAASGLGGRSRIPPVIPLHLRQAKLLSLLTDPVQDGPGYPEPIAGCTASKNAAWLTFQVEKVHRYPYVSPLTLWTSAFSKSKGRAMTALGMLPPCRGCYSSSCPKPSSSAAPDNATRRQ